MSNNYFYLGHVPYICKLCHEEVNYNNKVYGWCCHNCYPKYEQFLTNVPQYWRDLIGIKGMDPSYEEWIEEESIQQRLENGEITIDAARCELEEMAKKIMKYYQPGRFSDVQIHLSRPSKERLLSTISLERLTTSK